MALDQKFRRRFVFALIFGVVVFAALLFVGDSTKTINALRNSDWRVLPLVLLLAAGNYLVRFIRWQYYLRALSIRIPLAKSVTVFMSGLAMSITPGKFGELIKCYGLKQAGNVPVAQSAPIVFAERFTDLLSVLLLAGFGALSFHYGQRVIVIAGIVLLAILGMIMTRSIAENVIKTFGRIRFLNKLSHKALDLYEHMYRLLRIQPLLVGVFCGACAWFCECYGFYLVLNAVHAPLALGIAIFIYAFATLFGAITFLPGGLGATEGSLTGLLVLRDVPKNEAIAASLIIRGATLWFAVLVGMLWFLPNEKKLLLNEERAIANAES